MNRSPPPALPGCSAAGPFSSSRSSSAGPARAAAASGLRITRSNASAAARMTVAPSPAGTKQIRSHTRMHTSIGSTPANKQRNQLVQKCSMSKR